MGDPMGSTKHKGNISMLTKDQKQLFSQLLQNVGPDFLNQMKSQLQPMGQEQMDALFQKSYVDPAMQAYSRDILPAIQEKFVGMGAGSSGMLNQALARSAGDLSTALGSQYGQFSQNQQQLQQNAMSQYMPLVTGQTFTPMIQQKQGWFGPTLGYLGNVAGDAGQAMASAATGGAF